MSEKTRDGGTAVWWFVAAAIAFSSIRVFFTDMPSWFQVAVMGSAAVLLVGGIVTYRRERPPRPPRR